MPRPRMQGLPIDRTGRKSLAVNDQAQDERDAEAPLFSSSGCTTFGQATCFSTSSPTPVSKSLPTYPTARRYALIEISLPGHVAPGVGLRRRPRSAPVCVRYGAQRSRAVCSALRSAAESRHTALCYASCLTANSRRPMAGDFSRHAGDYAAR